MLENARQSTRLRKYDLYDLFCAVAYVLKTGCQWRQLPVDFPRWQSVYYYCRVWFEERILKLNQFSLMVVTPRTTSPPMFIPT